MSAPTMQDARDLARLEFARRHLGPQTPPPVRASSDAGFRSYWRCVAPDGSSRILMDSPPERERVEPWLAMQARLSQGGVRVPQVLARDAENGWLLLEDLGRETLLDHITQDTADDWMARAIAQLVTLQRIEVASDSGAFDEALVRRDMGLFRDWFLSHHLGLTLLPADLDLLEAATRHLLAALLAQPQVLVHRDYILRNLMPLRDGVAVLDFQDAVRGPLAYDAASLFEDAFISWPPDRVARWQADYHSAAHRAGLPVPALDALRRDLSLVAIQRHLKILGIFARLHHRDAKPRYLEDAPRFLAYLDRALPQHPELSALHALLRARVFPALASMELPA